MTPDPTSTSLTLGKLHRGLPQSDSRRHSLIVGAAKGAGQREMSLSTDFSKYVHTYEHSGYLAQVAQRPNDRHISPFGSITEADQTRNWNLSMTYRPSLPIRRISAFSCIICFLFSVLSLLVDPGRQSSFDEALTATQPRSRSPRTVAEISGGYKKEGSSADPAQTHMSGEGLASENGQVFHIKYN